MQNFYDNLLPLVEKDTKNYYYFKFNEICDNPIYVKVNKKAFNLYSRLILDIFGTSGIEALIENIVLNYLINPQYHVGIYHIEIDENLQVVRVHDLCYINKKFFDNQLILHAKENGMDIWKTINYYIPNVRIVINNKRKPHDDVVTVSFKNENSTCGKLEDGNLSNQYTYVISVDNGVGLGKVMIEYILLRSFLHIVYAGWDNGSKINISIDDFDSNDGFITRNVLSYYHVSCIDVVYDLVKVVCEKNHYSMLQYMSEKLEVPIFIVKKFLNEG